MHLPVVTPAQMASADRAAIAAGTPGIELMERAGRACTRAAVRLAGGIGGRRFVVVAGPGNNGGDGWVVARRLYDAGAAVRCVLVGDAARISGDARVNLDRLRSRPVAVDAWDGELGAADVVVDAVFGTGMRGGLQGDAAGAAAAVNASEARVLAVDIPSGIDGATGAVGTTAFAADLTVAIEALKFGHVLEPGARRCGTVEVAHVGIAIDQVAAELADAGAAAASLPRRTPDTHKWAAGAVLVLGGSTGMAGAPSLVSAAAFAAGAGLVVAGVPACVQPTVAASAREVMTLALADSGGAVAASAMAGVDRRFALDRFGAVAVGPGLGHGPGTAAFVADALAAVPVPLVLDADGLNNAKPASLRERRAPTVLTPHEGEFARLGGEVGAGVHRVASAVDAAQDWGSTVLLKGPATVVATPGRMPVVCRTGGPELAR
ncbi:MAG: NAD(P)H-hydrate epimerase, partial [Acidimicrobiia bacterium]|nr:NAD(P)H-hydrate epimerase [Acidimicrobiia bacterium]